MKQGFKETVACVRDAGEMARRLCALTGWEVLAEGVTDSRLLEAWRLPANCTGRELVLGRSELQTGFLRLMELEGVQQSTIRSNSQIWDVGGILDLNVRVTDMEDRFAAFSDAGWRGCSDPVQWRFGDKLVSEWLAQGSDGLVFALIERLAPPLEPGSIPGGFGHIFNSTQVVADMERALTFYEGTLGFHKLLHICQPLLPEPGANPLGIPHNLIHKLDAEIAILSPSGEMDGSVELIRIEGLQGRDFSARACPPNLGMLSLRFPVDDLDGLQTQWGGQGLAMEAITLTIAPYGLCRMLAVQAPDGGWLEFFEPLEEPLNNRVTES